MPLTKKTVAIGQLETWVAQTDQAEVHLVPSRGGLVTRFRVHDDEVLFIDESTLIDPTKNVRGGIPQLFPFPGKPPAGSLLPQHGFARKKPWTMTEAIADEAMARLECRLLSDEETLATFPHQFALGFAVSLVEAQLTLEWQVRNTGATTLPLHLGLHPYFRVPMDTKARAHVAHRATRAFDNTTGHEVPAPARISFDGPEVDLHLLDHPSQSTVLHRGDGKRVELSWTPNFKTLVLWTQPQRPFICVEPWTAPAGALANGGALEVPPGNEVKLAVLMSLH